MDISEWKQQQEKKGCPPYSHFDDKVSLKRVWNKISNPIYITHHSFYPFIHYQLRNRKVKNGVGQKPKIRDIYYASHWDSWIYRYYSFLLNEKYNEQLNKKKIGNVVAAYRTSLGKSNINFAYDAFDFLQKHQPCYVLIGDFKDFFDQLDHAYLKKQLCNLMGVEKLPDDYFAVFKNITRFSYCELDEILKDNGLEINKKSRKELFKKKKVLPPDEFDNYFRNKKVNKNNSITKKIFKNKNGYGIPQGSPISGTLANIYMLEIDKIIAEYIDNLNGYYIRYSDDFIIIIPNVNKEFNLIYDYLKQIFEHKSSKTNRYLVNLQPEKTQIFYFDKISGINNCTSQFISGMQNNSKVINFLGFCFDGKLIRVRDKTVSKYYNRMYRKIKEIIKDGGYTRKGNKISCKNLYEKYSQKGLKKKNGNFFSYLKRVQSVFQETNYCDKVTPRHMFKIRSKLNSLNRK